MQIYYMHSGDQSLALFGFPGVSPTEDETCKTNKQTNYPQCMCTNTNIHHKPMYLDCLEQKT